MQIVFFIIILLLINRLIVVIVATAVCEQLKCVDEQIMKHHTGVLHQTVVRLTRRCTASVACVMTETVTTVTQTGSAAAPPSSVAND